MQIETWLDHADPQGLLDRIDLLFEKAERDLGPYKVHGLKIELGERSVQVVPVARKVVGSSRTLGDGAPMAGRVDITDGIKKYTLWRALKGGMESREVLDEHFGAKPTF